VVAFVASCSLDIGQLSLTRGREPAVTVSDTIRLVGLVTLTVDVTYVNNTPVREISVHAYQSLSPVIIVNVSAVLLSNF